MNPSIDCSPHGIYNTGIIRYVLSKGLDKKCNLTMPLLKASMTERHFSCSHVDTVTHSDIVQLLVPAQTWFVHFFLPKLICQVQCSYTPLLRKTFTSSLCIVTLTHLLINLFLSIGNCHHLRLWTTLPPPKLGERTRISFELLQHFSEHLLTLGHFYISLSP